ncbi:hypothetical protein HX021_17435 [Sphingobacterium sp. N143]|uniref:hypothetical protein n=1 Tax=Sphingobacterium sp. N143 TaxID=2746727 RepID=UPI0025788CD3|nr:hypothetical protein [Sphingobacterium sp. N143]MDM1296075.1 hypothetical protein [Sphingobacterium sp. N143]
MTQDELIKELSKPEVQLIVFGILAIRIIIWLLFANTIRKTLKLVAADNRLMTPNQSWLVAIPLVNIYWNFQVASRLRDSLINEFYDRKIAVEENPTYRKGSLYAWIYLATNIPMPFSISGVLAIMHFVTLANYWFNINANRRILEEHDKFREKEVIKDDEN